MDVDIEEISTRRNVICYAGLEKVMKTGQSEPWFLSSISYRPQKESNLELIELSAGLTEIIKLVTYV